MPDVATYELIDQIAIVTMDDGKANAFSPDMIATVNGLLDRAEKEAKAVVLTGRDGIYSGGFDLRVIRGDDPQAAVDMRLGGTRLMMRLYGLPLPLVIAASGHAIALGAFCLLTGDYRIGTAGDFRVGLNETSIGMSLPPFGLMLARERLSKRYLTRATMAATMFSSEEAKDAGFLDEVVPKEDLVQRALDVASSYLALDGPAYASVKQGLRSESIAAVLDGLDD
ncbi:MAG: crotonase/enoyl-CoA hydratase family protein [Gammaproteobacteria bacterium]|nr:crotonase/enoyl-CoA hydratase family protein [Gammaproteobacteria bacterium]